MAESSRNRNWTYEQTLIAFRVYRDTEYGKLNQSNAELAAIAEQLGRTPSALIMKCCNFASMDPFHAARGVKGLANKSQVEIQVWEDFLANADRVTEQVEDAWDRLTFHPSPREGPGEGAQPANDFQIPTGPSEVERTVRIRRLQRAFRSSVLVGYKHRCALTGLAVPALLNASHIIPWAAPGSEGKRADPRNGLCLNALHDRAFDR